MNEKETLPNEVLQKIEELLKQNRKWQTLEEKLAKAEQQRKYIEILQIKQTMDNIRQEAYENYRNEIVEERIEVGKLYEMMPKEDAEKVKLYLNSALFILDYLDTLMLDTEAIIHKSQPGIKLVFYERIKALGKEVRKHVDDTINATRQDCVDLFIDYSDQVSKYLQGKIKNFLKEEEKIVKNRK